MLMAKLKEIDNINFEDLVYVDEGIKRVVKDFEEWRFLLYTSINNNKRIPSNDDLIKYKKIFDIDKSILEWIVLTNQTMNTVNESYRK